MKGGEKAVSTIQEDKSKKVYLLVLYYESEDSDKDTEARFITGQSNVRDYIKNVIDQIDINLSFVLVENIPFGVPDGKPSVYQFLKWIAPNYNDGFSVEDYVQQISDDEEFDNAVSSIRSTTVTYQDSQIGDLLNGEDNQRKELN